MWYEFLIEGLKTFAGEIIGLILIAVFFWKFPKLKDFIERWKPKKNNTEDIRQVIKETGKLYTSCEKPAPRLKGSVHGQEAGTINPGEEILQARDAETHTGRTAYFPAYVLEEE